MKSAAGRLVGIDLGTTNSALAYLNDSGQVIAVPNSEGETITPSVLFFRDDGVMVGKDAKRHSLADPSRAVSELKRKMGSRSSGFTYRGRHLCPEAISALVLKKIRQDAEKRIGPICGAVIGVPFYFDDTRRKATQDAGRIAGLDVIDIVNEPVAATLCYAYGRGQIGRGGEYTGEPGQDSPRPVLVYDLGGGTFDVAYVLYTSQRFQVVATDGDVRLGGLDWTQRLADFAAETFYKRFNFDMRLYPIANKRLIYQCDEAKHTLSEKHSMKLNLAWENNELEFPITRDEFEFMTSELLLRTETTTRDVMEAAKVSWDDLADIILVGGASRMPMVRKMLERSSGWLTDAGLPASEPVALGAAIHAEILRQRGTQSSQDANQSTFGQIEEINVNSHNLGIAIQDNITGGMRTETMIPRNTQLPYSVKRRFFTVVPEQQAALVQVLEGEAPEPAGCVLIGKCLLNELASGLPPGSPVEVTYSYETSGRVRVRARDLVGGRIAEQEIFHNEGLKSSEVEELREFVTTIPVY